MNIIMKGQYYEYFPSFGGQMWVPPPYEKKFSLQICMNWNMKK